MSGQNPINMGEPIEIRTSSGRALNYDSSGNPIVTVSNPSSGGGSSTANTTPSGTASSTPTPSQLQTGSTPTPVGPANPLSTALQAQTTGGWSTYSAQGGTGNPLLTSTAVAVKSGAGTLAGFDFLNTGTAAAYVQVFDATTATLGTTVPKLVFYVPPGGGLVQQFSIVGIAFSSGITLAATTTATGNIAPATGINANVEFK